LALTLALTLALALAMALTLALALALALTLALALAIPLLTVVCGCALMRRKWAGVFKITAKSCIEMEQTETNTRPQWAL
jgi:hypothetical protein